MVLVRFLVSEGLQETIYYPLTRVADLDLRGTKINQSMGIMAIATPK